MSPEPRVSFAQHADAVTAFIATARQLADARWNAVRPDGKWSAAQIAEHLRLTYLVVGRELNGHAGLRVRTPWWIRPWLRFRFLRGILKRGVIPEGARAPRELLPGPGPFDRDQTLAALQEVATAFERTLDARWTDRAAGVTHHVFGRLRGPEMLLFATVHVEHHQRQLARLG